MLLKQIPPSCYLPVSFFKMLFSTVYYNNLWASKQHAENVNYPNPDLLANGMNTNILEVAAFSFAGI